RRRGLEDKIPDIRKTLNMVEHLQSRREAKNKTSEEDDLEDNLDGNDARKPLQTTFELNDMLFAEAELEDTDTVFLWLGVSLCALSFDIHSSWLAAMIKPGFNCQEIG
ncbi:hypothetical protein BDN71DRAFT_1405354, partial [Pleurotus eryngii]